MTIDELDGFFRKETSLQRIDKTVKTFQRSIPGTTRPVFVPLRPRADSIPNDCFENVRRQKDEAGGEIVHGWRIHVFPKVFLNAEFHAVWKAPDGRLEDVSPPPEEGTSRIVFFPDPTRSFEGEPVPSRHWQLIRLKELREYFEAYDEDCRALRESARRKGTGFNEPVDRSDPALDAPRRRLAAATLALAAALSRLGLV